MTISNQQYRDQYKKLSQQKKEVIASSELSNIIDALALSQKLETTKRNVLALIIKDWLYELSDDTTSSQKMKSELSLSEENATKLFKETEEKIFKNLERLHDSIIFEEEESIEKEVLTLDKRSPLTKWGEKFQTTPNQNTIDKAGKLNAAKKTLSLIEMSDKSTIPQLVESLPVDLQDVVFDKTWIGRTKEIAKKYTLDATQTETLVSNVLFVLVGIDKPEDFMKLMTSELGISRLLADQIVEDLEMRVFEYVLKTLENREKRGDFVEIPNKQKPLNANDNKNPLPIINKPKTPEIRPSNLPMVEKGEVAHNVPPMPKPTEPTYKPVSKEPIKETFISQKTESQSHHLEKDSGPETVQRPVAVPRFVGVKMEENETGSLSKNKLDSNSLKANPLSMIDSKLKAGEMKISVPQETKTAQPNPPASQKYTVDPYREPME